MKVTLTNFFHDPNLELSLSYETLFRDLLKPRLFCTVPCYTAMNQTAATIGHNLTLLNVFASTLYTFFIPLSPSENWRAQFFVCI